MDETAKFIGDVPPKASRCTVRKVGGGFIVEYEAPAEVSFGQWQQVPSGMASRPTVTREHVVPDVATLEGFLAVLLR